MDAKTLYQTYVSTLSVKDETKRFQRLIELLTPDFVAHDLVQLLPPGNVQALSTFRERVMTAFPDQSAEILDMVLEDNRLACRQLVIGTHNGPFQGIPPTGRRISTDLFEWVRFQDGRIAERWVSFDRAGLLEALRAP